MTESDNLDQFKNHALASLADAINRIDSLKSALRKSGDLVNSHIQEKTTFTTSVNRRDGQLRATSAAKLSITVFGES
jgi:hypothetical protein